MLALGAHSEAADSAGAANGAKTPFAPGQQLVDVGLVADIPNEFVPGRGEHVVQRQRQLHHSEVRPQVAAVFGQHRDQFMPDFLGQLLELFQRQFFDVDRVVNHVEISVHNL